MTVHSKFGGSIIGVISHCHGYANAVKDFPNETNPAAEKGTAYHECAEYCERLGFDAKDVEGLTFNGYECDNDMIEAVQIYLNYIRSLKVKHSDLQTWVEGKVVLSSIAQDVFGYADHLGYSAKDRTLYVTDLKGGFILVDADGLQTPYYAIGALDTFKLWFAVDKVVCTIVQPCNQHAEGFIRSRTYDIDEIYSFKDLISNSISEARKKDAERNPGHWCKYCPAAGICRKRMERTVFLSTLAGTKADLTNDEIAAVLAEVSCIERNLKTLVEYANTLARGGSYFEGFKLVKPILRANCENEAALIKAVKAKYPNYDTRDLYNPGRLKGKSVLRKQFGNLVDDYFDTPQGNAQLVPISNPRPAINNDAGGIFSPIKD